MNGLMALASEFLETVASTSRGRDAAEEAALRLAHIVEADTSLGQQLANPSLGPEDVHELPLDVWTFWLDWRVPLSNNPPPTGFLEELFHVSALPIVRLRVLKSEVWHPQWRNELDERRLGGETGRASLPAGFVRAGIIRATNDHLLSEDGDVDVRPLDLGELGRLLMQLGDRTSLIVLRAILETPWQGQPQLIEQFDWLYENPPE